MNNAEINSLKTSIQDSSNLISSAVREKTLSLKAKDIAENNYAGIEYELQTLKIKFEKREKELLGLLEERSVESEASEKNHNNILEKLKSTEKELSDLQLSVETNYNNLETSLKARNIELQELREKLFEANAATQETTQLKDRLEMELKIKISELETNLNEKEEQRTLHVTTISNLETIYQAKELLINELQTKICELETNLKKNEEQLDLYKTQVNDLEYNINLNNLTIQELEARNSEFVQSINKNEEQIRILESQLLNLDTCNKMSNETINALKSELTQFTSKQENRATLSEFLSQLFHVLGMDIILESNSSICADDLAGAFTLNSTNGIMITEDESQINESIAKTSTLNVSSQVNRKEHVTTENPETEMIVFELSKKIEETKALNKELEQARDDIKELKKKNKTLQVEYDETSMQLMEAIQDYDKLKAESDKLNANNESKENNNHGDNELQTLLSTSKVQNGELQIQLDEATKQIENFKQELNELRSTLEKLVPIVAEKDKLDLLYHDKARQLSEMDDQLMEKTKEIESLKKSLEDYKTTITNLTESEATLTKALSEKIESPDEEYQHDLSELKIKIDALEKEAQTTKNCLIAKETENQNLLSKIDYLQTSIEIENAEKIKINEMLLTEIDNVKKLTSELDETQKRLEQNVSELNLVKTHLADAEVQLSHKSKKYWEVQTEKEALLKKIVDLKAEIQLLEQETESLKSEASSNGTETPNLIKDLKEIRKDLDLKCVDLIEKSEEIVLLTKTLDTMENKVKMMTTEKASLLGESAKLNSEIDDLSQKFRKASEEKFESEERLKQQCEKMNLLQQELFECLEKLDQKVSASSDLESKVIAAQNIVEQLSSDVLRFQNQVSTLIMEKEILVNQQTTDQKVLKDYEAKIKSFKMKQASLMTELEQLQAKMDTILADNSKYKTENSNSIMNLALVEEKLAVVGEKFSLLEPKYEQALGDLTASKNSLSHLQSKLNSTSKEISSLRQNISVKDQKLHELTIQLEQLEAEREQHTKDMFELDDLRKRTAKDRRSRRQSAHDELRSLVRPIKAIAVQTDPTDENCQCTFLNEKLEKQKIELLKAKVTADHYRLGNDQKVGDIKEEKEKVERKLNEVLTENNRLVQESARIRRERENLRERLKQTDTELKRCQERANRHLTSKEVQTEFQMPIINMNSDAVSLDQKVSSVQHSVC